MSQKEKVSLHCFEVYMPWLSYWYYIHFNVWTLLNSLPKADVLYCCDGSILFPLSHFQKKKKNSTAKTKRIKAQMSKIFHPLMTANIQIKFKGFTAALSFSDIIYKAHSFQSHLQFSSDYHLLTAFAWSFHLKIRKKILSFWHQHLSSGKCSIDVTSR